MNNPTVLFDGVCNLCDSTVQFIIKEDKKDVFKFATLQSDFAKKFLIQNNLILNDYNTVILILDNRAYFRSNAILKILMLLGGYYKLFALILKIIPRFIRDLVYNYIAEKRYLWFGKKDKCLVPTPEIQNKFIA